MVMFSIKTQVYSGSDSLSWLQALHNKKVWIICDAFLADSDNLRRVTDNIGPDNEVSLFTEITPDPPIATVVAGLAEMSKIEPHMVIGFGGGSALDCAKAIIYFARQQGIDIERFIAIPTTSGTGSEVTRVFVISDPQAKVKYPLFDDSIYPDIALLEPKLVASVPPAVTANTGLDVLTHALEAYVSKGATDFTDALAEKAVQLVFLHLPGAYRNGNDLNAREKMHHASTLAGMAFSQAGLGLNHAIAHQLGGQLHIPHGLANALLLCEVIRFNCRDKTARAKYARLSKLCGLADFQSMDERCVTSLTNYLRNLMQQMQVARSLGELNFSRANVLSVLDDMTRATLNDATFPSNPLLAGAEDIKAIIRKII